MAAARKTGPRPGLSRDKILDAAIAFVDEHGLTALSTRKLGATLGVEGMTLYYYVPSKAALLDGMVERLLQRSLGDLRPDPGMPWPEAMRQTARALHAILREHPAMVTVVATRPASTPVAFALLESGLEILCGQGVPLGLAVHIINTVTSFVIGHTLAEVGQTPGHEGTEPIPADVAQDADAYPNFAEVYPNVAEVLATGAGLDVDTRFELVLDILVTGFAAIS
ncbi:MAG TPA: TetR/AcrR family transcriptional regulator C-terminal domain-containing protein [Streptosporangiaceae bacterium]|jgi:AcrR family transcriptional regulator